MSLPAIKLVGDRELQKKLEGISTVGAKKVMRAAIRAGLKPIRAEARQRAHPTFRRMIRSKVGGKKNIVGRVFVDATKSERTIQVHGREVSIAVAANFLEFGTPHIAPRRFMRGAREDRASEAMRAVTQKANERLPVEWAKADKKGKLL